MPIAVDVQVLPMSIFDANELHLNLLLDRIVIVPHQTEIPVFVKFILVLFFGV